MERGRFIVLEGIDGAGTTTQAGLLKEKILAVEPGREVVVTAEPTDRTVGRLIRDVLGGRLTPFDRRALALLFAADRLDHIRGEIVPLLDAGKVVISDRYVLSSLAYQGMDAPREWVAEINRFAPVPDLTLYLDCRPEVAFGRIEGRRGKREMFETFDTITEVARAYRASIEVAGGPDLVEIDGNLPATDVADLVWREVERLFA